MIAKHVPMRSLGKSDFAGLVNYVTDAQNKEHRLGLVQITNCDAGSVRDAITEILATQYTNTRAKNDKTYHLIVSFRAGEQPDADTLRAVEERICAGLGYGEHQRISAVHNDTDNLHIHIAINKIHPTRHTMHEPYYPHLALADLCETLERDYGLEADNHRPQQRGAASRAADMERHAGVESLVGWIKRKCLDDIKAAQSWTELHQVMRDNGLEITPRGNGLVIRADDGTMVKPSSLARDLSKPALEKRLGAFEASPDQQEKPPRRQYQKKPVRSRADTTELYARYKDEQKNLTAARAEALAAAKRRKDRAVVDAKQKAATKRAAIKLAGGGRVAKKLLYSQTSATLRAERDGIYKGYSKERERLHQGHQRRQWADWLKQEATQGNSEALAALRAREVAQGLKGNTVKGQGQAKPGHAPVIDNITKAGTIIYRAGASAVRDDGDRLQVSTGTDRAGVQEALRLAAERHIKLPNVEVDASKVQESGLIKDTILLDIPDNVGDFDTVLVRRATDKLKESSLAWSAYLSQQQEGQVVVPLMVLQVPNTPDPDEIGRALDTIFERYPELPSASVAHVFGDHTTQRFGNRDVPYIEPQRVQESTWVRVLIAKDAISTGWDCPRAEVMVSFRAASDKTHITQLLGRLVRSPLARRIPGNDRLNSVDCLLPKFNRKAVEQVVDELTTGNEAATPGRVLIDYIEVRPNPAVTPAVWETFEALPSQTRPQRGAKPAVRLTALAHELASDDILAGAGQLAHAEMHAALDEFQADNEAKIKAKRQSVLVVDGKTVKADLLDQGRSLEQFWEDADVAVIDDAYRRAARIFSPAIAHSYVDHLASQEADRDDDPEGFLEAIMEARVTVAGLGLVLEAQAYFDTEADRLAKDWLAKYEKQIKALSDDRRESYRQIIEMSTEPQDVGLLKPEARYEATKANENGQIKVLPVWDSHLLCNDDGKYPAELNGWERTVVETESARPGFSFWYRNPQQPGQASLGIAYENSGKYGIVRPDFLFFATQGDGSLVVDLVDPHGVHLSDALAKLQGLALYAANYADAYRRIESIAQVKGIDKLRVLDLKRPEVRDAIAVGQDAEVLFSSGLADDYQ